MGVRYVRVPIPCWRGPTIPGHRDNRVFISGNFRHGSLIDTIKEEVLDCGFTAITLKDFGFKPEQSRHAIPLLLECKYGVFEVSENAGGVAIEVEWSFHFKTISLYLWDIYSFEEPWMTELAKTHRRFRANSYSYMGIGQLRDQVRAFLQKYAPAT